MIRILDANQVSMLNQEAVSKVVNATYGAASFLWYGQSNGGYLTIKLFWLGDGRLDDG
ncbi:hypothetical protein MHH52_27150 [Paenibacillus sp. FSL K6-0276]|uniref:hypothetical protein n=1 Tax=Paenibacillus sp. FSL K6-0276 TaxID=2921450 RepID=UPI0030EBA911